MQAAVSHTQVRIEFAQASDPGRDPNKQVNEDSCGYQETRFGHLCVLCDGMGGHYGGKEASRMAITTIFELIDQMPAHLSPIAALQAAVEEAGRRVYRLGGPPDNRARPGSTVVAMLVHDGGLDVAHVGDSRAFVIRSNQIYPLTRDHSMVQAMVDAGMLTEEQAIGHPDANKITRALGMKPEVEVEVRPEPMGLFAGDLLLQASDGLTDLALGPDILGAVRQALASGSVAHACNQLVQLANSRGGHDNITVQIVRVLDNVPKVSPTIPHALGSPRASGAALPAGPVPETLPMTAPDATVHPGSPPEIGAATAPLGGWPGVPPTALDTVGPSPTLAEEPPVSQAWNSERYPRIGAPPLPPLATGPLAADTSLAALPLPPRAAGSPYGAGKTHVPHTGSGSAFAPGPSSLSRPDARPAQGGIVFVVIGLSAVIAVLILILVWALFLR